MVAAMNSFKLARYEAGLTIAEAAAKASVSEKTVRRLESDETETPTPGVVKSLAGVYQVPVARLLGQKAAA